MTPADMLAAVSAAERFLARGMEPRFAVGSAAHLHAVDAHELALLVLTKRIACARARDVVAAMHEADEALEHQHDRQKAITPAKKRCA